MCLLNQFTLVKIALLLVLVYRTTSIIAQDVSTNTYSENWLCNNSDLVVLAKPIHSSAGAEVIFRNTFKVQKIYTVFSPIAVIKDSKGLDMREFKVISYKTVKYPPRSNPPVFIHFFTETRHITVNVDKKELSVSEAPLYLLFLISYRGNSLLYEPTGGHDREYQSCLEVYPELSTRLAMCNTYKKVVGTDLNIQHSGKGQALTNDVCRLHPPANTSTNRPSTH